MKKIAFFTILFFLTPSILVAQTTEVDRRIEEEKRISLRATEEPTLNIPAKTPASPYLIEYSYFQDLFSRKVAFRYDICHALVVLMGVSKEYTKLDEEIDYLERNGIIPKRLVSDFEPNKPLRKGLAAYMFCRALNIKGGLLMRIFSWSQRYALNELVYEDIILPGSTGEIVSGKELILTLTEAASYMSDKTERKQEHNDGKD